MRCEILTFFQLHAFFASQECAYKFVLSTMISKRLARHTPCFCKLCSTMPAAHDISSQHEPLYVNEPSKLSFLLSTNSVSC